MKAYAMISGYLEDFSTQATVAAIKTEKVTDFTQLPWERDKRGEPELYLKKGEALFLYGGRSALAQALAPLTHYTVNGVEGPLVLFRAQRTVANGIKVKQLLMLTWFNNKLTSKLKSRRVPLEDDFDGEIGMAELGNIIQQLKLL